MATTARSSPKSAPPRRSTSPKITTRSISATIRASPTALSSCHPKSRSSARSSPPKCAREPDPMRIAILSDIHDNVWKLAAALETIRDTDAMICCGDLCSPFIAHQIGRGYAQPVHIVFGNNDGDPYRITTVAGKYPHLHVHGEFF